MLAKAGFISPDLSACLQSMVGFRNVAVHDYRELDAGIVSWVIEQGFEDLLTFADGVRKALD